MDAGQGGASKVRRIQARAHGRVQGVAYRAATRAEALHLGLTGWVQNDPDGSVRLQAQGAAAAVAALVAWCNAGPPHARVTRVDVEDLATVPAEDTFRIRY